MFKSKLKENSAPKLGLFLQENEDDHLEEVPDEKVIYPQPLKKSKIFLKNLN